MNEAVRRDERHPELRAALRALCADFPPEYFRKIDAEQADDDGGDGLESRVGRDLAADLTRGLPDNGVIEVSLQTIKNRAGLLLVERERDVPCREC